jgi:hypothetical protein
MSNLTALLHVAQKLVGFPSTVHRKTNPPLQTVDLSQIVFAATLTANQTDEHAWAFYGKSTRSLKMG